MTETYNGYSNRQTWLVHTWLTNDADTYHAFAAMASEAEKDAKDNVPEVFAGDDEATARFVRHTVGRAVHERVESSVLFTAEGSLTNDLLLDGLARVEWAEVAEGLL